MPTRFDPKDLLDRARPHVAMLREAAERHGLTWALLGAIVDRESLFGRALKFGTGDWTARPTGGRYELGPRYRATKARRFDRVTQKWIECEGVMPKDGLGWGRGWGQIDYAAFFEWLQEHDWRDPQTNLYKSAEILRAKIDYCGGLRDHLAVLCGMGGYNAGEGTARKVRERLDAIPGGVTAEQLVHALDAVTTGGDYVSDVIARRRVLETLEAPTPGVT
jgi:hypothetical protein